MFDDDDDDYMFGISDDDDDLDDDWDDDDSDFFDKMDRYEAYRFTTEDEDDDDEWDDDDEEDDDEDEYLTDTSEDDNDWYISDDDNDDEDDEEYLTENSDNDDEKFSEREIYCPDTALSVEESEAEEDNDEIKRSDFQTEYQYEAAYRLRWLSGYDEMDEDDIREAERCRFILESDSIAAKYLTVNGVFLLSLAIKEHFDTGIEIIDEDRKNDECFGNFFLELVEEDTEQAVDIWYWCMKIFGRYQKYARSSYDLYNNIVYEMRYHKYPREFLENVVYKMHENDDFMQCLFKENPDVTYYSELFIVKAIEFRYIGMAKEIFSMIMHHEKITSAQREQEIRDIISECSHCNNGYFLTVLRDTILPVARHLNDRHIERVMPGFIKEINEALRYKDSDYNERYNEAVKETAQRNKYMWRKNYYYCGIKYGLNPYLYKDEEEFKAVIKKKQDSTKEKYTGSEVKQRVVRLDENNQEEYLFCGVVFSETNTVYHYLCDEEGYEIGDRVLVPVGRFGKEVVAKIASIEWHTAETAPYDVDRTKIIRVRYKAI